MQLLEPSFSNRSVYRCSDLTRSGRRRRRRGRRRGGQGCEHLGCQRCFADVQAFSANPIVVGTSVNGQLRLPGGDVDEAIPASPHDAVLVASSGAARPFVCRLSSAARSTVRVGFHRNAFDVQQPPPLRMQRMLHAGCVQLVSWYERPARCVPLDAEERVNGLPVRSAVEYAIIICLHCSLWCQLLVRHEVAVDSRAAGRRHPGQHQSLSETKWPSSSSR